ncbi:MAG: hypothetical protein R3A51_19145 [Nannocystaceae bacterium]
MTAARPYERDADHLRDSLRYLDARLLLRVAQVRQIAGGDPARRGLEVEGGDVIRHFERVPGAPVWATFQQHLMRADRRRWLDAAARGDRAQPS